jgi:hypothetical protein
MADGFGEEGSCYEACKVGTLRQPVWASRRGQNGTPPRLASWVMEIAALVVAIVSAVFAGAALVYYRRSAQAAEGSAVDSARSADAAERSAGAAERSAEAAARSADAAAVTAKLDTDRRHAELTPRFRITCAPSNPGSETLRLAVYLLGPPELKRLDGLAVRIRDDHPWRAQGTPLAGGPTPDQVAEQIWGRWRFTPGTGPGADPVRGIPGADPTGRITRAGILPVGEELPFQLEPTWPPPWSHQALDSWQQQVGPWLRLLLECYRHGQPPWILPVEILIEDGVGFTEVPKPA